MPTTYNLPGWSPRAPGASISVEPTRCTELFVADGEHEVDRAYRGREQVRGWTARPKTRSHTNSDYPAEFLAANLDLS